MRTIKFREWDGRRFDYEPRLYCSCDSSLYGLGISLNDQIGCLSDNLNQFTGLLDKNSREIYEGDIVNLKDYGFYEVGCFQGEFCLHRDGEAVKNKNGIYTKESGLRYFAGGPFCSGKWCDNENCKNPVEVVGNIKENPDLLK